MYELQNGIQFETIPTSNAENGDFKNSDYPSIYIAVLLGVHVFDCDVTGVPCEGAVCQCDLYLHFGVLFTILTKSPSWSSLLPIVLRTRRGAMRSGPTSQCPLKIHGGGQINTANSMLSSRELTTTALYLITPFEQGAIILC